MAGDHHHFPTFYKIQRFATGRTYRNPAGWISRTFFNERGLLRLGLYLLLFVCLLHIVVLKVAMIVMGMGLQPMFLRPMGGMGMPPSAGFFGYILFATMFVLGTEANIPLVMIAICLVGLAISAKHPEPQLRQILDSDLFPEPPAKVVYPPKPTERHPLDPDPDDPVAENFWRSRSNS